MSKDVEEAVDEFLADADNQEFISRILRHGRPQARAYALALIANASSQAPIDKVLDEVSEAQTKGAA